MSGPVILAPLMRNDDEHGDRLSLHLKLLREQRVAVEEAKIPVKRAKQALKDQQDELAKRFNEAKVDLGREYTREYLEDLIRDGDRKMSEQVSFETRRARDKRLMGQAVFGVQPDLFPGDAPTPTYVRDKMQWEAEGYLRGLRGDLEELQPGDPPEFHQDIIRGARDGQKTTQDRVARAMEAKAKENQPSTEPAVSLEPPEPGSREERKSIDRAKESLGVKPPANKVPV